MIQHALGVVHSDTPLIELRAIDSEEKWYRGLYTDRAKLVQAVEFLNRHELSIYWTLNRLRPRPATNMLERAKLGECIGNADVSRIQWLFLDLDGGPRATRALADEVEDYLTGKGWEAPVRIFSGRGHYLLYRVDLAPARASLVRNVVLSLKARFDREDAHIDKKCVNIGRIARVPGSYNHKSSPPTLARIL